MYAPWLFDDIGKRLVESSTLPANTLSGDWARAARAPTTDVNRTASETRTAERTLLMDPPTGGYPSYRAGPRGHSANRSARRCRALTPRGRPTVGRRRGGRGCGGRSGWRREQALDGLERGRLGRAVALEARGD